MCKKWRFVGKRGKSCGKLRDSRQKNKESGIPRGKTARLKAAAGKESPILRKTV